MSLNTIIEPSRAQHCREVMREALDEHEELNLQWLKKQGWSAIPVESGSHFTPEQIEALVSGFRQSQVAMCYAVSTLARGGLPDVAEVPADQKGLEEFHDELGLFTYLLLADNDSSAVFCSSEDFYVVAGSLGFLQAVFGEDLDYARRSFREFAETATWGQHLPPVADKYGA